jgi:hypothetical protein
MTVDLRNLPAFFNSNADFQAWVAGIHAQLAAVGLVQTSDTGQINPATVSTPGSASVMQGYEIWRLNDTLQSTLPVFIKVEYGSGPITLATPGFFFTVGTGSNGAGTLTGQVGQRRSIYQSTAKSAGVTLPSYCTGDGSGVALLTSYDPASTGLYSMLFDIERTRDGAGSATADGIYTWMAAAGSSGLNYLQMIPASGPVPNGASPGGTLGYCTSPYTWISVGAAPSAVGPNVAIMPIICQCGKCFFIRLMHLVPSTMISSGISFTASVFGGTHTLLGFTVYQYEQPSQTANDLLCLMWE